jgi:transposase
MPPVSKKVRRSRSNLAIHHQEQSTKKKWQQMSDDMHRYNIANKTGRSRTQHENKLIVGAIKMQLDTYIALANQGHMRAQDISMFQICCIVAKYLHVKREYVLQIQQQFTNDGQVLVFGKANGSRGRKPEVHWLLAPHQVQFIVDLVERLHGKGATVTNRQVRNTVFYEYGINLSRSATGMYLKRLGLTWKRVLPMRRSMSEYRKELMRLFLIKYDKYYKQYIEMGDECPFVFVFTDESYVHRTHCGRCLYFKKNDQ